MTGEDRDFYDTLRDLTPTDIDNIDHWELA